MFKKRENKEKRLAYIRNLMQSTGSTKINASEIARMFNVSETAIRGDLKEIYKEMSEKSKEDVSVELTKIDIGLKRGMRELEKIVESDRKPEDKLKAIEIYSKMASDYVTSKSRLGLFKPDGKGTDAPPVVVFNMRAWDMDSFIDYCVKEGHPEVKELKAAYDELTAAEAAKEALERDERLKKAKETPRVDPLGGWMPDAPPVDSVSPEALETAPDEPSVNLVKCVYCGKIHDIHGICPQRLEAEGRHRPPT